MINHTYFPIYHTHLILVLINVLKVHLFNFQCMEFILMLLVQNCPNKSQHINFIISRSWHSTWVILSTCLQLFLKSEDRYTTSIHHYLWKSYLEGHNTTNYLMLIIKIFFFFSNLSHPSTLWFFKTHAWKQYILVLGDWQRSDSPVLSNIIFSLLIDAWVL